MFIMAMGAWQLQLQLGAGSQLSPNQLVGIRPWLFSLQLNSLQLPMLWKLLRPPGVLTINPLPKVARVWLSIYNQES